MSIEHYFDIHREKPNWSFLAVLCWVCLLLTAITGMPWHGGSTTAAIFVIPLWALCVAGGFHFLISVPLLRCFLPERELYDTLHEERYQELLRSDAPDWMRRGAYLYLLHFLPIDTKDPIAASKMLETVGIEEDSVMVTDFLRDLDVGVMHVEEVLRIYGMAKQWNDEDERWDDDDGDQQKLLESKAILDHIRSDPLP